MAAIVQLPPGWRQCVSPDGRTYFQNEFTKQTQWNVPVTPLSTQQMVYTITAAPTQQHMAPMGTYSDGPTQNEDENEDAKPIKWWDKSHILLLITFGLTIYDFITDIQVASSWFTMSQKVCPQFGCYVVTYDIFKPMAYILLICSSFGFLFAVIMKLYEGYRFYIIYKYPMTNSDKTEKALQNAQRSLSVGWIPLVFEDIISLTLIFWAYSRGNIVNIKDISGLYIQSMILSLISVTGAILWSFKNRWKLTHSQPHRATFKYSKVLKVHCLWCCVSSSVVVIIAIFVLVFALAFPTEPIVGIQNIYDIKGGEKEEYCYPAQLTYNAEGALDNHTYRGELVNVPYLVYDGCHGTDYQYQLECADDKDSANVKLLHCTLDFVNYANMSSLFCGNVVDCEFEIALGVCQNYTIRCKDGFQFFDGDAVMWACFDYCKI